jgi:hypothetical protein
VLVLSAGDRAQSDVLAAGLAGEYDLRIRGPAERAWREAGHGCAGVSAVGAGQRDRAVRGRLHRGLIRGGLEFQPHRQRDVQDVAPLPDPVQRQPAARPGGDVQ